MHDCNKKKTGFGNLAIYINQKIVAGKQSELTTQESILCPTTFENATETKN